MAGLLERWNRNYLRATQHESLEVTHFTTFQITTPFFNTLYNLTVNAHSTEFQDFRPFRKPYLYELNNKIMITYIYTNISQYIKNF